MWKVVYIAPNKATAEMLKEMLTKEGFLVMLRPGNVPHMGDAGHYEILVPKAEAKDALDLLTTVDEC